jgi:3-hydroxyacyl-[acyl-carrier-protein] dehydratase
MTFADGDILARLPHQPPFRFISRVGHLEAGREGRAVWEVTGNEDFFKGHFPGRPLVPGVLIAEALAQLAGLVSFTRSDDSEQADASERAEARPPAAPAPAAPTADGRFAQMEMRFDHSVSPPAVIELHAAVLRNMGGLRQCEVRAEVDGRIVARGTLVLAQMDSVKRDHVEVPQ